MHFTVFLVLCFFSENYSVVVVPSPKNGNISNSPGSNVLVLFLCSLALNAFVKLQMSFIMLTITPCGIEFACVHVFFKITVFV